MPKLQRRDHPSAVSARTELVRNGYHQVAAAPSEPPIDRWVKKGKPILAIGREKRARSEVWHIVEHPLELGRTEGDA